MKKLIAVLLAMVMAFSCTFALAEEPAQSLPGFELPAFTTTFQMELDEEAALSLLTAAGLPEEYAGIAKTLLPLLNGMGEQVVFANNGLQYDLKIKDQDVFSLVAEATEGGFALSTDLLPSYVLTIKQETLAKLFKQAMEQFQTGIGQLDMEKIMEAAGNIFNYAMEMGEVMQNSVAFGEPVKGEYPLVDGVVFNTEKTLTVDVNAIMEAVKTLAAKVTADETIKSALESVASMIPGAEFDPAALALEDVPAEQLPEVTGLVYTITDDENNQTAADTYVIVNVKGKEDNSGDTNTYVYVNETSVDVIVEIPAEEVSVECYIEMGEDGVIVDYAISAPGADVEVTAAVAMGETGVALEAELYVNDPENAIMAFSALFELVGERTKSAFDGEKAELALDGLLDEQAAPEVIGNLMMDLMTNGLSQIINNVKAVMPEQGAVLEQMVGLLMASVMGGGEAVEAPAE
ncbi:MAG: hypothetical protein IJI53_03440 [Clostridia bacterium]|nr:hypothetical protein [Clostridia bacterium]